MVVGGCVGFTASAGDLKEQSLSITADDTGEDTAEHISHPNLVFLISYLIKNTADDTGEDAAEHIFCRLYWSIS